MIWTKNIEKVAAVVLNHEIWEIIAPKAAKMVLNTKYLLHKEWSEK